ncbi:MAG TPA: hypothetical protein GX714_05115 [Chloroflexi bacterium]|jgi:hypothetical protein|nr:hypothetical protein [Chloroflexota bacterium]
MPGTPSHTTTIARFDTPPEEGTWPAQRAVDALIRECSRLLFAECREDLWAWLSESDLQGMLYAILRRELPAHGLAASAVHMAYPFRITREQAQRLGLRGRTLTTDLVLVVPQSLRLLRGRRWTGRFVAAVEVKRGYERYREIRADLAKLAAVRNVWEDVLTYMVVMGHQSAHEAVSAVEREAAAHGVTLLADNYWVQDARINQPELV